MSFEPTAFEIVTVPCLSDNYAFLIHVDGRTALVDAPEAAPVAAELSARGWTLDEIWITHHHTDHIDGVPALRQTFEPLVRGAERRRHLCVCWHGRAGFGRFRTHAGSYRVLCQGRAGGLYGR